MSGTNWIGEQGARDDIARQTREIVIERVNPELQKLIRDQEAEFDGLRDWLTKSEKQMQLNLRQHESNIIHNTNLFKEMMLLSFQKSSQDADKKAHAEYRRWKMAIAFGLTSNLLIILSFILLRMHQ